MNYLLCEVLSKCYEISNKTKADVFFAYSPHVDTYAVYVYRDGWTQETSGNAEWLAISTPVSHGNLITTMAKLLDLESELEVA